ncbi:hypothetical protein F5X99DRAFT_50760 [Biscogniauxia marginata]|nr:hypothetical protein F5X99DRAFT_50760 [Biscogniauxia marginata]
MSSSNLSRIENLDRADRRLTEYFDRDELRRFVLEGMVGRGAWGVAWKIKYRPSGNAGAPEADADPETRRLILKTNKVPLLLYDDESLREMEVGGEADNTSSPDSGIPTEQKWLAILRYAKHIVRLEEPPDDPLQRLHAGLIRRLSSDDYIFLEYVENGELLQFLLRCRNAGLQRLPNRMLWRFFMCLVRLCIGLAWPPPKPDGSTDAVLERAGYGPPNRLVHGDLHDCNVMIGPLINDPEEIEHDLTPILKIIDFGAASEETGMSAIQANALTENLFDIARIMAELATLDMGIFFALNSHQSDTTQLRLRPNGPLIASVGSGMLPGENGVEPYPGLDPTLRNLICACLAKDRSNRPRLQSLANLVMSAIRDRDEGFYVQRGDTSGFESDKSIRDIVQKYILDAGIDGSSEMFSDVL